MAFLFGHHLRHSLTFVVRVNKFRLFIILVLFYFARKIFGFWVFNRQALSHLESLSLQIVLILFVYFLSLGLFRGIPSHQSHETWLWRLFWGNLIYPINAVFAFHTIVGLRVFAENIWVAAWTLFPFIHSWSIFLRETFGKAVIRTFLFFFLYWVQNSTLAFIHWKKACSLGLLKSWASKIQLEGSSTWCINFWNFEAWLLG
jgi:hypothetical protein